MVNERRLIDFSGDPKIVNCNKQIKINETSEAIHLYEEDALMFKDLSKV